MTQLLDPTSATTATAGTIYFDGACGMCTAGAQRMQRVLAKRGFALVSLQEPGVAEMLGLSPDEVPDEMKLRTPNGTILGGVDAVLYISRRVWWLMPLWLVSFVPRAKWTLQAMYRRIAQNRDRIGGACRI